MTTLWTAESFGAWIARWFHPFRYEEELGILYQSPNFLVVNKRHDILINSNGGDKVTVEKQLCFYFPHLVDTKLTHSFHFCHRLDYATSGLLCLALTKKASQQCQETFFARKAQKYYLALLHGHVERTVMVIDQAVGNDRRPQFSHCMCVADKEYCVKPRKALTLLLVLEYGLLSGIPSTKVLLKPITGRRHQLRVHCRELNHGVVGDLTYGGETRDAAPFRMFLHSYRLLLPMNMETIDVQTRDPFCSPKVKWRPINTVYQLDSDIFSRFPNVQYKE